jgi:proteic killer suppression protein
MKVEFADEHLGRICGDEAHKLGLPFADIVAARRRLLQLHAAADEVDLINWKSLNFKKLEGIGEKRSIKLTDQHRIVFTIKTDGDAAITIILGIGDAQE